MLIPFLIAKIHRAVVTSTDLNYNGSIAISEDILEKAGLRPYQQVDVYNITNGNRFTTYCLSAPRDSRTFMVNGAAAHLAKSGDVIIVAAYGMLDESELNTRHSVTLIMNDRNEVERTVQGKL
jgi:aspartate 1-decarboxylase